MGSSTPFRFPEHPVLAEFVRGHLACGEISLDDFRSGRWLGSLPALLGRPRTAAGVSGGAESAASAIAERLVS